MLFFLRTTELVPVIIFYTVLQPLSIFKIFCCTNWLINKQSFISETEWAPLKSIFWKDNDWIMNSTVPITKLFLCKTYLVVKICQTMLKIANAKNLKRQFKSYTFWLQKNHWFLQFQINYITRFYVIKNSHLVRIDQFHC